MYKIRTPNELRLFYQYASMRPTTWESLINVEIEHSKFGSGTILDYRPSDGREAPKIKVCFDAATEPEANTTTKILALPLLFDKGLIDSLALPESTAESFQMAAVAEPVGTLSPKPPDEKLPPPSSPTRKPDWRSFREVVAKYHIDGLYHFTDSRNLASIEKYGGLYSWWQCNKRGIKIPVPGGNQVSRSLDRRKNLEDYVRLSFNWAQPMMHVALQDGRIDEPVILKIDPSVIYLESTLFSDVNANDGAACVGGDLECFKRVKLSIATGLRWSGESEKKSFQAEVLVKSHIPLGLIGVL